MGPGKPTAYTASRGPWSRWVILCATLVCGTLTWQWQLHDADGPGWKNVIRGDAKGYYSYLPALIIHGDLSNAGGGENCVNHTPQGDVRKYPLGTALAQLPFFLVADGFVLLTDGERTGYEQPYQITIALGGVLALLLGLLALRRVLLDSGFGDRATTATLIILSAGTSLVYVAVSAAAYSHIWSFMAVSCFLRCAQRAITGGQQRWLVAAGAWLGLIILIRPVNGIVFLALPLILEGWPFSGPRKGAWPSWRTALMAALACGALLFLQPWAWKAQTGYWIVWSYADEGFHWTRPEVLQVLFGPMKGLFFWWPILLVVVPGLAIILRRSRAAGGFGIGYFALLIYITSAWWCWYYGDGYGLRPIIDHLPVLAIPIAVFVGRLTGTSRMLFGCVTVALCALQCFQIWQYHNDIIHPHSMSLRKYRAIFLETQHRWRNALGGNHEMAQYAPNGSDTIFNGTLEPSSLSKDHPFSPGLSLDSATVPDGRRLFVQAEITRTEAAPGSSFDAMLVCEIGNANEQRYYYTFRLNDLPSPPAGRTETWTYAFRMGPALPQDGLKLYVWQTGEGRFTIDRFTALVSAVR